MKKLTFLSGLFLLTLILSPSVFAQTKNNQPTGITISPALQEVSINADDSGRDIEFSLTNHYQTAKTVLLTTADFDTLQDTGGLFFIGSNPTELQKKYGLAAWLSLPEPAVVVPAGQTIVIKATVLNQPSLAAGGHYGSLSFSVVGENNNAGNRVGIKPVASSLIFLTKHGGDTYRLKLDAVQAKHSLLSLPSSVDLKFENSGNTHLVPRGTIEITDSHGKLIKNGVINENSAIILPAKHRTLRVPLQQVSSPTLPGHYKMTVNYRFEGIDDFRTYQASFWLATPSGLIVILIVLIGGFLAYFYLFKSHKLPPKIKKFHKKQSTPVKK
jgi:hypothetical protein